MPKLVKVVTHHKNPKRSAELFAECGVVAVGWNRREGMAGRTKDETRQVLIEQGIENLGWGASQLIKFRDEIGIGDRIIAYRKKNTVALAGTVETGEYKFNSENEVGRPEGDGGEIDYPNQKKVNWRLEPRDFSRNFLPEDLSRVVASRGTIRVIEDFDVNRFDELLDSIAARLRRS